MLIPLSWHFVAAGCVSDSLAVRAGLIRCVVVVAVFRQFLPFLMFHRSNWTSLIGLNLRATLTLPVQRRRCSENTDLPLWGHKDVDDHRLILPFVEFQGWFETLVSAGCRGGK